MGNRNLFKALIISFLIIGFILKSIIEDSKSCDRIYSRYKEVYQNLKIDSLYIDKWAHANVAIDIKKNKLLYLSEFLVIQPSKGDSIYKEKGKLEYVLIKHDSTYVQSWNCELERAFLIDKWKNGEKKYIPSSKAIPQIGDSSNSVFFRSRRVL